jgi:hypothetical protein
MKQVDDGEKEGGTGKLGRATTACVETSTRVSADLQ